MLSQTTFVNSITLKHLRAPFLAFFLLVSSSTFSAPMIRYEIESIGPNEIEQIGPYGVTSISSGELVNFVITDPTLLPGIGSCMEHATVKNLNIDALAKTVHISINVVFIDFGTCPPVTRQTLPAFTLTSLGEYLVKIYNNSPNFDESRLIEEILMDVTSPISGFAPEVPAEGSIQSGVGMIRGWVCDATSVEVSFDGGERIPVAYGTSREDTREICGDANNGYGMVIAWGVLGEGTHRMRTYLGGINLAASDVEFEVSGIGEEFAKDLSGTYELQNFPAPGESVTVEWSEPHQNFIIVDHN